MSTVTRNLVPTPFSFEVVKGIERPRDGDPFEILWVKFDFEDDMWHDEVMWDIRYLLMGSKMKNCRFSICVTRGSAKDIHLKGWNF